MQHQVAVRIEADPMLAEQVQGTVLPDHGDPVWHAVGVDRARILAGQAEQHRTVAAVPVPGRAERAEQFGPHRARAASSPLSRKPNANSRAAFIGPTVCELDGPMPILNRSKTLMVMTAPGTADVPWPAW